MPNYRVLIAVVAIGTWGLHAQPCTSQAKRTIEQGVRVAGTGDLNGARHLFDHAAQECPTSFAVFRDLAKSYRMLGDAKKGDECETMANRLDPRSGPAQALAGTKAESEPAGRSVVRDKWALVVGVGKFQRTNIPSLEFAAKDARDFAKALTDPQIGRFRDDEMHVKLLTDEQATLSNIRSEINYIAKNAREEDLVVLYVSSHGTSAGDDTAAKAEAQTGYIVTHDTDTSNLYGTALAMDELKRVVVDRLRSRRVVTFLDTCFSGDTVRWAKGGKALSLVPPSAFQGVAQGTGRVVIGSSQGTEISWEGNGNSYFTKYLIDAMKQKGGMPTVTEVFSQLQLAVRYIVKKERNQSQNPIMWPERGNDIVIGTPIQ